MELDHTPLTFGKYKSRTPDWVSKNDPAYLVWAFETVTNKQVCSELLYKHCLKDAKAAKNSATYYKPPGPSIKPHFDSYDQDHDDEIPF